jgi:hypothetical protein
MGSHAVETELDEPPFVHNRADDRSNAYQHVEASNPLLTALAACALLVAGLALGVAFWARSDADAARKEALVAKLRTEGFTRALIARGIDPYPHLEGEDP